LLPLQTAPSHMADAIMKYAALPDAQKTQMAVTVRQLWQEKFDAKENALNYTEYLRKLISE